jgi:hypothetical protein
LTITADFRVDGQPLVTANVYLVGLRPFPVAFVIDTASPASVLITGDMRPGEGSAPIDDRIAIETIFGITEGVRRAALLTFASDGEPPRIETADLVIAEGPPGSSRLGRDILNRWLFVYDGPEQSLLIEPLP